jgi:ComF family protein
MRWARSRRAARSLSSNSLLTVLLVRWGALRDKLVVRMSLQLRPILTALLDFALPPRCPGCACIVSELHAFCSDCWRQVQFLGNSGCDTCGMPLEGTESGRCGACLAHPPRIARTRAAVAYDDLTRRLAIRLKYGRKIALARTMARYMVPLIEDEVGERLIVPVPLHRGRLWSRGFNQAAIVGSEIARRTGIAQAPMGLRRLKRTPPLRGMSAQQRRRMVQGAFAAEPRLVQGKGIILIDDVLTTGSTADSCARALKKAGATKVELLCWARVVRPLDIMR